MEYDEFRAMSTDVILAASGDDLKQIKNGFSLARDFVRRSEARFTRFTDTNELAWLNRSAGKWLNVSADMFQVIDQSLQLARETDGFFNPAVLPALIAAGYDRSIELIGGGSPQAVPHQVAEIMDFSTVQLDEGSSSVLIPFGMQVDLGGIAKGWIVEQAALQLAKYSDACAVSAGGDMFLVNTPRSEQGWEVGLENPLAPAQDLAVLHVPPGGLATSSTTKRQWHQGGRLQHHLIDPRTGEPAQSDWLSVTVWAETAVEAEVYAKALLIAGPSDADALSSKTNTIAYLAVDKNGWVVGSENYHEVFHVC